MTTSGRAKTARAERATANRTRGLSDAGGETGSNESCFGSGKKAPSPAGFILDGAGGRFPPKAENAFSAEGVDSRPTADAPAGGKGAVARSCQQPQRSGAWEHAVAKGEALRYLEWLFEK